MIKFLDICALATVDPQLLRRILRPNVGIGAIAGTFGRLAPIVETLCEMQHMPFARVHLGNGSCLRMARCEVGEPKYNDFQVITNRARTFQLIAAKNPHVKIFLSPFVEYGCRDQGIVNTWFQIIRHEAPSCTPIASSVKGWLPPDVMHEYHGANASGDIISGDGDSNYDFPYSSWSSKAKIAAGFWCPEFNLHHKNSTFEPPTLRKYRVTESDLVNAQNAMGVPR